MKFTALVVASSTIAVAMVIYAIVLLTVKGESLAASICGIHSAVLLINICIIWLVANIGLRWAIFPYSAWFVYQTHKKDANRRLSNEMIRLLTEVKLILKNTMTPEDQTKEPDSLTLFDYREKEALIVKLIDTNELFMEINVKLIDQGKDSS
jgi:hypothetical protein